MKPAAPPSLLFRAREAVHEVAVPLALLVPLLPALAVRPAGLGGADAPGRATDSRSPSARRWSTWTRSPSYEDFAAQNPFAVVGFVQPGALRLVTIRGVMLALDYAVRHVYNDDEPGRDQRPSTSPAGYPWTAGGG